MSFTSIASVWVEVASVSHGWRVVVKDELGYRHLVGDPHDTLDAALTAARHILSLLS